MDASEILAKRLNSKGDNASQNGDKSISSVPDGRVKLSGGNQALTTSTLIRNQPVRGVSHQDFLGDSEGLHHIFKTATHLGW